MAAVNHREIALLGLGIAIPSQSDAMSLAILRQAEAVFHLLTGPVEEAWIRRERPDAVSLFSIYSSSPANRHAVYREMAERVIGATMDSQFVALAQYGHPTVDSTVSQLIIERVEPMHDVVVKVVPGISSVACLFADIGFDPALEGVHIIDASLATRRQLPDPETSMVLLQIGLFEDSTVPDLASQLRPDLRTLSGLLIDRFGPSHKVLLYEAAVHIAYQPRREWIGLGELAAARFTVATTLFIPSVSWFASHLAPERASSATPSPAVSS